MWYKFLVQLLNVVQGYKVLVISVVQGSSRGTYMSSVQILNEEQVFRTATIPGKIPSTGT